jgi:hypothetical protein
MRVKWHRYAGLHPGPRGRVRFKNLFTPSIPAAPTPPPPPTMPDPNSANVLAAKRQAIAQAQSGGRSSTILTTAGSRPSGAASTLAGGAYSSTKTGSSS